MLIEFFLVCAVTGGAFVLAQVLLSLFALGTGHGLHLHHGKGPMHAGARGGMRAQGQHVGHLPGHHGGRIGGGSRGGGKAGLRGGAVKGSQDAAGAAHSHWASEWFLGLLNLQGVTAGAAVLGLAGLSASAANMHPALALGIGIVAAILMMAAVAGLLTLMNSMDHDGTVRLEDAVGQVGTVYLAIPGNDAGLGKISLVLREQVMEFSAATAQETGLLAGEKVIVVSLRKGSVMEVVSAKKFLHDIGAEEIRMTND